MNKGYRFQFHGSDAKGTITEMERTAVSYTWDHDTDITHVIPKHRFLELQTPLKLENNAAYRAAMQRIHGQ